MIQPQTLRIARVLSFLLLYTSPAYAEPPTFATAPLDWGIKKTATPEAWRITRGRKDVVVAIIDTGIDVNHPALKENLWVNPGETGRDAQGRDKATNGIDDDHDGYVDDVHGWNFAAQSTRLQDDHGHGTHIAGIIKGLAPNVRLMILKYYDAKAPGTNNLKNTIAAIRYATAMKADIINYSGGGPDRSYLEFSALQGAQEKGILVVAAAGNEKSDTDDHGFFPASYELTNIISVTAIDPFTKILNSSNFGRKSVDIAAPGQNIYSTLPDGKYGYMTGTSQATAFVSGAAALVYSRSFTKPDFKDVKRSLEQTGDLAASLKAKTHFGAQLNSYRALAIRGDRVNAFDIPEKNILPVDATPFTFKN